jgi:hypothetical protein
MWISLKTSTASDPTPDFSSSLQQEDAVIPFVTVPGRNSTPSNNLRCNQLDEVILCMLIETER